MQTGSIAASIQYYFVMAFPIKTCSICGEEFELKPGKPGFANRCPDCSAGDENKSKNSTGEARTDSELNAARRKAMRDLLYRKDS
jgi:anaerobic ribonucleoside-triphosphate reductase